MVCFYDWNVKRQLFLEFQRGTQSIALSSTTVIFFYQLFRMIPTQHKLIDSKPKELPSLRRKAVKAESIPTLNLDQGVFFSTISLNRQIQSVQHLQLTSKTKQTAHQDEIMLICSNKIYNKKEGTANVGGFGGKNDFRRSLNKLGGQGCQTEEDNSRPRTSAIDKFHKTGVILNGSKQLRNDQNRPGSSKSSRLFKHKGPLIDDSLEQNAQTDSLIRVTSNACSRPKGKSSTAHRSRVGTSLSHLQHSQESVPSKLDPTFYRLFAK